MELPCTSINFPTEALMEEIKRVVIEKFDFEPRDKSIITPLSVFGTAGILMQRRN